MSHFRSMLTFLPFNGKHLLIKQALCVAGLLFATTVSAAEFTADTRVSTPNNTAVSKFFYAGDRWRLEEKLPKDEYRVTIFRSDLRGLFVLWPAKKRYIFQPLPEREFQIVATRTPGEEIERTEYGQEKVADYVTTKYRVTYRVQDRVLVNIEWFSKELGVVIKSQAEDNSWSTEFASIREAKQDAKLFEIPAGYNELSFNDVFTGRTTK